jgi:nucleotide-binding universal stress UspA family protein
MGHAEQIEADLIVAGAHSVSKVQKLAFGSTTETLIKNGRGILFLDR